MTQKKYTQTQQVIDTLRRTGGCTTLEKDEWICTVSLRLVE